MAIEAVERQRRGRGRVDDGRMSLMEHLDELRSRAHQVRRRRRTRRARSASSSTSGSSTSSSIRTRTSAEDRRSSAQELRLFVQRPARGLLGAHQGVDLRRHRPGHAGAALAAVAVRLARALHQGAALRRPVRLSALVLFAWAPASRTGPCRRRSTSSRHRGGDDLVTAYSPSKYFQLIVYMMLAFGIGFEFPVLLVVPRAGRRPDARDARRSPPLRHRRHRRARGRHHAVAATRSACSPSRSRWSCSTRRRSSSGAPA